MKQQCHDQNTVILTSGSVSWLTNKFIQLKDSTSYRECNSFLYWESYIKGIIWAYFYEFQKLHLFKTYNERQQSFVVPPTKTTMKTWIYAKSKLLLLFSIIFFSYLNINCKCCQFRIFKCKYIFVRKLVKLFIESEIKFKFNLIKISKLDNTDFLFLYCCLVTIC